MMSMLVLERRKLLCSTVLKLVLLRDSLRYIYLSCFRVDFLSVEVLFIGKVEPNVLDLFRCLNLIYYSRIKEVILHGVVLYSYNDQLFFLFCFIIPGYILFFVKRLYSRFKCFIRTHVACLSLLLD